MVNYDPKQVVNFIPKRVVNYVPKCSFYAYVLYSDIARRKYTGFTSDLNQRMEQHNEHFPGAYTNFKGPWKLIYFEEFENKDDALKREKYFKTGSGREFIRNKTGY